MSAGEPQETDATPEDISNVSVHMIRPDMDDVPQFALPAGYRFRLYRPGDDVTWTNLQIAAEPFFEVTPELFVREYGKYWEDLPDRMFFVETEMGEAVASISAWWDKERDNPGEAGRIHWVVVHPQHQRRGLTKPMMTRAMARLAESHPRAMLGTSTGRIWAIKVYLDFGFVPDPAEIAAKPQVAAGWQALQTTLQHPRLAQALAARA